MNLTLATSTTSRFIFSGTLACFWLLLTLHCQTDPSSLYSQINQKFLDAGKAMLRTLKFANVWRPCVYMYASLALSLNVFEGMFYWYTDAKGPNFSQVDELSLIGFYSVK